MGKARTLVQGRVGQDFAAFDGENKESDPASIARGQFVTAINVDIPGPRVVPRAGESKVTPTALPGGKILGLWDVESMFDDRMPRGGVGMAAGWRLYHGHVGADGDHVNVYQHADGVVLVDKTAVTVGTGGDNEPFLPLLNGQTQMLLADTAYGTSPNPANAGRILSVYPARRGGDDLALWGSPAIVSSPDATTFEQNLGICLNPAGTVLYVLKYHVVGGVSQGLKCARYNATTGALLSVEAVASTDAVSTTSVWAYHMAVEPDGTLWAAWSDLVGAEGEPTVFKRTPAGTWSLATLPGPGGSWAGNLDRPQGLAYFAGSMWLLMSIAGVDTHLYLYRATAGTWALERTVAFSPPFGGTYPGFLCVAGSMLYYVATDGQTGVSVDVRIGAYDGATFDDDFITLADRGVVNVTNRMGPDRLGLMVLADPGGEYHLLVADDDPAGAFTDYELDGSVASGGQFWLPDAMYAQHFDVAP